MLKTPIKSTKKTLRDEDVVTRREQGDRPLTARTKVRAGMHGSDFNSAKNANNGEG
jgi:hypothetical protein